MSLLAFSFYDATPEARAATLERLRAAWEANTVLAWPDAPLSAQESP